jgi:hypothetical protein
MPVFGWRAWWERLRAAPGTARPGAPDANGAEPELLPPRAPGDNDVVITAIQHCPDGDFERVARLKQSLRANEDLSFLMRAGCVTVCAVVLIGALVGALYIASGLPLSIPRWVYVAAVSVGSSVLVAVGAWIRRRVGAGMGGGAGVGNGGGGASGGSTVSESSGAGPGLPPGDGTGTAA